MLDRTSFPCRIGALMTKLLFALDDELEWSAAEPIMAWMEGLSKAELAAQLVQLHAAATVAAAARVELAYYAADGDLTDEPGGPLACTDFVVGDGLTKALIGIHTDKPGVELIIGGSAINEQLDEVLTLADVRQLRDNLTVLMSDERLVAALVRAEAGAPHKKAA
jgi:hypothetical protein